MALLKSHAHPYAKKQELQLNVASKPQKEKEKKEKEVEKLEVDATEVTISKKNDEGTH